MTAIEAAIAALGPGALREPDLRTHVDPLFSRVLSEAGGRIYLANHSLGRPLDKTADDVAEGLAHWYADLDSAWSAWRAEMLTFRSRIASLLRAPGPDCIVPKTNAGQGLRAVLNRYDRPIRVVSTRGEFDSIEHILKVYASRGRIEIDWISSSHGRRYRATDFMPALRRRVGLLVVSMVFFDTGQLLTDIATIVAAARAAGADVLVDLYHAAGVLPIDVTTLDVDYAIGGSYKYLRGGPGAGWLYVHPRRLETLPRTLDTGWFASNEPLAFERPDQLRFARGADGWLDATPAVLPFYQARAGLELLVAIGVERLRAYSLEQQRALSEQLDALGVSVVAPNEAHGAFVTIESPAATALVEILRRNGVVSDARGDLLRLCPDILTTRDEIIEAAQRVAHALGMPHI